MFKTLVRRNVVNTARSVNLLTVKARQQRQFTNHIQRLTEKIQETFLMAPKGFEKFYRKNGEVKNDTDKVNKNNKEATEPPKNTFNSKNDSSSNNKDGKNKKSDPKIPEPNTRAMWIMLAVGLLATTLLDDFKTGREINWQDFQKHLLETGMVERIIVSNKNVARVVLRQAPTQDIETLKAELFSKQAGIESGWKADGFLANDSSTAGSSTSPATATGPGDTNKFTRYPSIGSPAAQSAVSPYYFNIGTVESFERKLEEAQRTLGIPPRDFIPVVYVSETNWGSEILRFVPTLLLIGAMFYMLRGAAGGMGGGGAGPGGIFKIGKSPAKKITKEQVSTSFKDVAGCDEAKKEIMEFVQFLKDPKKFTDLGARIPKGALLCGPPGTGKTLLARATAGEASVPFFAISGSDFVEMFVGVGPSRVRDLFKEARENAPCIVFIDEIDAVGRQRGRGGFSGSNDERENTLNQMLVEMDGFDNQTNVVVLAGTNRVDVLDQALTRPGRFDRQITVDRPDIAGRRAIFEIYLKTVKLSGSVQDYAGRLAALTPGFVGADIANICNEAAIIAARRNKAAVELEDFESATDRVIGGLESKKIMSAEEKKIVAFHEAGHAVAGWNLEHADPLLKVTIVPRGSGALGFAQYLPKELFLRSRDQILDMVCMALAGRAAEQVVFGKVTTGASDDLRRVTQIVYQMVQVYGMNDKIGQLAFPKEEGGYPGDRLYSDATAEVIDSEVRVVVAQAYERTLQLIETHREQVTQVATLLMEKETITNSDISKVIGDRPYSAGKEYDEYLKSGWNNNNSNNNSNSNEDVDYEKQGDKEEDNLGPAGIPVV